MGLLPRPGAGLAQRHQGAERPPLATKLTPEQFKRSTGLDHYPDYFKNDIGPDGALEVYANGEVAYTLRGVHAKVAALWRFEAPPGAGDTHYALVRGTRADLVIKQGAEQNYKPALYVENKGRHTRRRNSRKPSAPPWPNSTPPGPAWT